MALVFSEWDTAAAEAPRGFMSPHWELNLGPEDVNGTPPPPVLPLLPLSLSSI